MNDFRPELIDATDSHSRTEALCRFIDFWLGPRHEEYGESQESLADHTLPMPLRQLYEFAGRWPGSDQRFESEWAVGAFSTQDALCPLNKLKAEADEKLVFLTENQGVWDCRTLTRGDDPPVWCKGDQYDEDDEYISGERLVCESLSRFLVTFVLQELTLGSRFSLFDDGLSELFESQKTDSIPLWLKGPYVHGTDTDFYLWNDVLVANLWGGFHFGANHALGIEFLTAHQGPIEMIGLMVGEPWRLDIGKDGSAKVAFYKWPVEEEAEVPAGSFDFETLRDQLLQTASSEGHPDKNPIVFFRRRGQSCSEGQHLDDVQLVTTLFRLAVERSSSLNRPLANLFSEKWPY